MNRASSRTPAGRWLSRMLIVGGLCCLALTGLWAAPAAAQSTTMLSGYVFGYDGATLADATITVFRMPEHVAIGPPVQSNADGAWSIDTGSGTFAARAEHPGYGASEFTVYPTEYTTGITFLLPVSPARETVPLVAHVTGQVRDLDGVPLGGMAIYATNALATGLKQVKGPPILSATQTDAAGHYSLDLPAGEVWLGIKTGAGWGYQQKPRQVQAGDNFTDGDFVVAIRTGAQYFPPTATPAAAPTSTPTGNVGPIISPPPGMPVTGQPDLSVWPALLVAGLLALFSGAILRGRAAPRR
jgi:hypothetical protein